jgi:WD40 repeat protein
MVSAGNNTSSGILIQRVSDGGQVRKLAWEHEGFAGKLLFSPDGSLLAAFSYDGFVKVWRVADGTLLQSFAGVPAAIQFMAISPDDQTLALPAADGLVFYGLANGQVVHQLQGNYNTIDQAALSPLGDRVAALIGSTDPEKSSVAVWTFPEGRMMYLLPNGGALGFAWSPSGDRLALAGWDGKIRILRSTDGTVLQTLAGHSQQVHSVAWSPDGTQLASSSFSVKVWRVSDGTLLHDMGGSGQGINSLNFSPDGKVLAGSDAAGKIEVWQTGTTKPIAELPVSVYGDSNVIAFAPDSSFLAVAEMSRLSLWHLDKTQSFLELPVTQAGVITLRISPDGSLLACGLTNGTIQLWQIPEGKRLQTLLSGTNGISSLDFSSDGKTLLSASRDGTIRFWSIQK